MKIKYRHQRFNSASATIISQANQILQEASDGGWGSMTLRQLYYQFVSRDFIPNQVKEYKRLGTIITNARYAGLIDWDMIEDAGRNAYHSPHRPTAEEVLRDIDKQLCINPWLNQDYYVEIWVEKQALESTIARPSYKFLAPYMACKGYLSASEAWRASLRFEEAISRGKQPILLHLGDHDPSGIDMTRDNDDRLFEFLKQSVNVNRVALNMNQIEEHKPPPNPAKEDDTRFASYKKKYGENSWELDALPQKVIGDVIEKNIVQYIDKERWNADIDLQTARRKPLANLSEYWPIVEDLLRRIDVNGDEDPMHRLQLYDDVMDMKPTNTKDLLNFIFDRLTNVYKESPNVDYMTALNERIEKLIEARTLK